jgi:hypothetical protein
MSINTDNITNVSVWSNSISNMSNVLSSYDEIMPTQALLVKQAEDSYESAVTENSDMVDEYAIMLRNKKALNKRLFYIWVTCIAALTCVGIFILIPRAAIASAGIALVLFASLGITLYLMIKMPLRKV